MKQQTFSDIEYSNRRRKTKREKFLELVDETVDWKYWAELTAPYYPSGERGRPPKNIETMLRMYVIKKLYRLSDKGTEEAIYDSYAMRNFMKLDFMTEQVPESTTLRRFRQLMDNNAVGDRFFKYLTDRLKSKGYRLRRGVIAEAAAVCVPDSDKKLSVVYMELSEYD